MEEDDEEYEEYEEEVDSDADYLDDFEVGEDDFTEAGMVGDFAEAWQKTPPFTKMYLSASCAVSLLAFVTNKNQFPAILSLQWKPTLQRMQLWRLLTPFLNFGPFGLVWALTAQFVWTYMSTLERMHHDRPYDFWIMVLFGCINMVAGYGLLKMPPRFLGHNLSTFLVYVWSRYHEGMEVSVFDLFTTRAELLPWIFLAQTFLLEGEPPTLDMLGILFGHMYHHCKTMGKLRAPNALVNWYNGDSSFTANIREKYKEIAADFEMQ